MKYKVRGKGIVEFHNNDYLTEGGEGKVFVKGDLAYKIFLDQTKMIPEAKIHELEVLNHPQIIRPIDVLLDQKDRPIGFSMKMVKKAAPLCKLFTNTYRDLNLITPESTLKLVENIKNGIVYIHDVGKCLIVDVNEMNFLVSEKDFISPYFIDVNSYQTPSYKATVIMPAIRDWKTKGFTTLTDWYSFGIITFQLFVGIHPFKGKHPDYSKKDLLKRMTDGVSVLDKQVRVPSAMRDLGHIPVKYMQWYRKIFSNKYRIPPPDVAGVLLGISAVKATVITSTDNFEIKFEREFDSKIIGHKYVAGKRIVRTKNKIHFGKIDYDIKEKISILVSDRSGTPIKVSIEHEVLILSGLRDNYKLPGSLVKADEIFILKNVLYVRRKDRLMRFVLSEINQTIIYTISRTWNIMPHASQVLNGMVYQNVLGKAYALIPVPERDACIFKTLKELEEYKIIDGKYENQVAVFIGHKKMIKGVYDKIIFRFDDEFNKYSCRVIEDVGITSVNFTVLDNGVALMIHSDNSLDLFNNHVESTQLKTFHDNDIHSTMSLSKEGVKAVFFEGTKLYSIKMK